MISFVGGKGKSTGYQTQLQLVAKPDVPLLEHVDEALSTKASCQQSAAVSK